MKFRKKPVVIEAFQWTGGEDQEEDPVWIIEALKKPYGTPGSASLANRLLTGLTMMIFTLEGSILAKPNDWIIQGIKGEIYPCKPDIFEATYEAVTEHEDAKRQVLDTE